ncbi:DNA segregation ATPase FtsK/SpoIIIE, S-DNA-T family [Streptomyces sp. DvalAA-14]|uniref:FtsK/SpoIIIE domain-containing protein n=1 Tax=unclassified Streptomyces TaxID=2593676 RepID=UPI00081B9A5D|nr:FtsK/SpoIIIE domain-containing protein [Streptomyces sp. DvalAA-14]MYS24377.1 cell division protein FtsK [Streptomyces sp. SID4948]SCE45418.1 DNA segregation ATPase FtsK/SpoIIIE, S-DNA-T family [Streptomyces sp. DvalAA-14]
MRLSLTVVDPLGGDRADVVVDADPASTVAEVARELGRKVGGGGADIISISGGGSRSPGAPAVYVDGYAVDPGWSMAQSPLREGAVVSLYDPAGCVPGEPAGVVELRVAGGPDAGAVHRLGIGRVEIGRGPAARIRIDDSELADRAAVLTVGMGGTCQVTVGAETKEWPLGGQLTLGNTLLELGPYVPPNAALRPGEDGATYEYNRPPRLSPPERVTLFRLPAPPSEPAARPLPWLMALTPLVMAVSMAFVLHRMIYLLMAVVSPVVMVGNYFMDKKTGRKSYARTVTEYRERRARIEQDARDALDAERKDRAAASPDPATVLNTATGPRTRLWERRRGDADHLLIRVGTAKVPSEVVLDDPQQEEHRRKVTWQIDDAPVALELRRLGVIGFAAPGEASRALGRWAVAQAAALSSPMDVQFYVLTEQSGRESWDWVRWLPHARPTDGQDASALMGTDAETVAARIAELGSILDGRRKARQSAGSAAHHPAFFKDPDIVVILDGSRRLRAMPGVVQLLREGPDVGMFLICLDTEERFLPGECQGVVVAEFEAPASSAQVASVPEETVGGGFPAGGFPSHNAWYSNTRQTQATEAQPAAGSFRLRVEQAGAARIRKVRPDLVSPAWCARLARCLSPIRDISGDAEDSSIPSASRLLDVLDLEPPTAEAITARWRLSPISTQAVVGESYDGPFAIDIRKDGPHGLIAGTTGSGKSELLQTIVASLAVANTPEAMTFVLVDYKGGSAFKDCVQLPHTVGMVTDLDAHLVERALESLGAELKRREHILAGVGAKDIEDYTTLLKRQPQLVPMPRLLIVIDEFASMVRDLPDFVTGLVNIAQRGRSLGIHLILATQRPSGVVSPEIRANTNLRIALRVTDGSESSDVIDAPDAGTISKSTPGRAYVRLGATSLVPFQSGRVGGRRPGAVENVSVTPWVDVVDWSQLGRSAPQRPAGAKGEEDEITDLKVLVEAIRGANERLAIPAQHSPWLPALPDALLLEELPAPTPAGALAPAPYGVEDLPALQARQAVAVDFHTFGHLLAAGAPRSGRSQLLRTIAGSLARTHSTADLHLYGIDCGNGALNALTKLPHCGAVVGRSQSERAIRLIGRLKAELTRRQDLLAADGFADIGEQRGAVATEEERLPHIVVLLDRWEGWTPSLGELDHGALTDELFTFLREGASVGIHLVITGDRTLMAGRISTLTEDKIAFRLADRSDFALISVNPRKVPDAISPGRAYRSESGVELQVALLDGEATGQGQAAALTAIGAAATERDAAVPRSRRPFRVDVLPSRLSFADAWQMRDTDAARNPLWSLVGVGGDELTGHGPDLSDGLPAFVIGGPGKSGRSTLLLTLARGYQQQGVKLVVAAPRPSPIRELAGGEGVLRVFTGSDIPGDELAEALEKAEGSPVVVVIDDAELLRDCDARDVLKEIVSRGTDQRRAVVLAGAEEDICSGFSGWQVDAKKARRGVLLSPQQTMSGELIGTRLSRSSVGGPVTPGRALLHLGDGEPKTVTVPLTV